MSKKSFSDGEEVYDSPNSPILHQQSPHMSTKHSSPDITTHTTNQSHNTDIHITPNNTKTYSDITHDTEPKIQKHVHTSRTTRKRQAPERLQINPRGKTYQWLKSNSDAVWTLILGVSFTLWKKCNTLYVGQKVHGTLWSFGFGEAQGRCGHLGLGSAGTLYNFDTPRKGRWCDMFYVTHVCGLGFPLGHCVMTSYILQTRHLHDGMVFSI